MLCWPYPSERFGDHPHVSAIGGTHAVRPSGGCGDFACHAAGVTIDGFGCFLNHCVSPFCKCSVRHLATPRSHPTLPLNQLQPLFFRFPNIYGIIGSRFLIGRYLRLWRFFYACVIVLSYTSTYYYSSPRQPFAPVSLSRVQTHVARCPSYRGLPVLRQGTEVQCGSLYRTIQVLGMWG